MSLNPSAHTSISAWRYLVLLSIVFSTFVWAMSLEPLAQDVSYHAFADKRWFIGIPNFLNVSTNFVFLIVGLLGLQYCINSTEVEVRRAWMVFFAGVFLVSIGSAYYHLNPDNGTLVWDRLPMTLGFMGLTVALIAEYVGTRLGEKLLIPAVLLGLVSVVYWHWLDDLRPYLWVQFIPLLIVPSLMLLFHAEYNRQWLLVIALIWYILAKVTELYDVRVYEVTGELLSGHSAKHLLAALSCYTILIMLKTRHRVKRVSDDE